MGRYDKQPYPHLDIKTVGALIAMEVVIKGPTFFGAEDEERFFAWMYALPAYQQVIGSGRHLHIHLREPVDDETVRQLVTLCRRWCIDITPLRKLRRAGNERFILWDQTLPEAAS